VPKKTIRNDRESYELSVVGCQLSAPDNR
jgi:hypothetical protein